MKVEPKELADGLRMECETKKGVQNKSFRTERGRDKVAPSRDGEHGRRGRFKREDQKFLYWIFKFEMPIRHPFEMSKRLLDVLSLAFR